MMGIVETHASMVDALVGECEKHVLQAVDEIDLDVSRYLMRTLEVVDGAVQASSHNAEALLSIPEIFDQAVGRSNYKAAMFSFVSTFKDQIEAFGVIHREDMDTMPGFPEMSISDEDKDIIASRAAGSLVALEGPLTSASIAIRSQAARSLGFSNESDILKGFSDIIRKIQAVKPIAKDQMMIFFRSIGNSVYRAIESQGFKLLYAYVGPHDGSISAECSRISRDGLHTREKVDRLKNREGNLMVLHGGHVACRHWWRAHGFRHSFRNPLFLTGPQYSGRAS